MAGNLGLQRVGAYFLSGMRPTFFLTSGGEPIPGTGQGNLSFYRAGAYASMYLGRFDVTGVFQRPSENVFLANGWLPRVAANHQGALPAGARGALCDTETT